MKDKWQIKKLGEVCEKIFAGGDKPKIFSKNETENLTIPVFANGQEKNGLVGFTNEAKVFVNCLTVSGRGSLGFSVIHTTPFLPIIRLIVAIPNNNIIDLKFLKYSVDRIKFKNTGGTIPQLTVPNFSDYTIPLPPLTEQKRIVQILDKKFAGIEKLKTNAQQSLNCAKELFEQELTNAFSNEAWQTKKLGEVCEKKQNIKWKEESSNVEYQYIDLSAVDRETKSVTETQIITKETAPSRAQQIIKKDDILFGTTRPTLKRFCLLNDDYDEQICSTGFCVIRPNKKQVLAEWLFYQFYDENFYKYIEPLQKGANYPAVTDKDVNDYTIPLPPLTEQKNIVKKLDTLSKKVSSLQQIYQKQLLCCAELKQALLQKALTGEL